MPTTWQCLSKLTQDSTSTLWEPQGGTAAELTNTSNIGTPQEETDTFEPTNNHFEQDEHNQAPPLSIQDNTGDDEPIARRTRGRLQHQQCVANEATEDGDLGESVADQEHTEYLSVQDRMHHPVAFLAEMCGDNMYFAQAI